ncbi:MAG: hypothetical protein AB8B51_19845 [Sedimentitalea sp.]
MTAALDIPALERGVLRVFQLEMRPEQIRFLREDGAVRDVLGAPDLDESKVHIIAIADLGDLGLAGYLSEGCAVSDADLAPDQARLAAITGHVLALPSSAFADRASTLRPAPQLRLIATYGEVQTDWRAQDTLRSPSASKVPPRQSPRANRAASRRVGGIFFAVFMVLILLGLAAVLT